MFQILAEQHGLDQSGCIKAGLKLRSPIFSDGNVLSPHTRPRVDGTAGVRLSSSKRKKSTAAPNAVKEDWDLNLGVGGGIFIDGSGQLAGFGQLLGVERVLATRFVLQTKVLV